MKTFLVNYRYENSTYSIDIKAETWQEAERRLMCIKHNGEVIGELQARIPVPTFWQRLFGLGGLKK